MQTVTDAQFAFERLQPQSDAVLRALYWKATKTPGFWECPGASKLHHVFVGGLAVHTAQVLEGALALLASTGADTDTDLVRVAVVWHDVAKTLDYEPTGLGKWKTTFHRSSIGHLSKSAMLLHAAALAAELPVAVVNRLVSLVLCHHGRKEWGSPVEPYDAETWAIHAADMLSAHYIGA